jgi:hypothetical protein
LSLIPVYHCSDHSEIELIIHVEYEISHPLYHIAYLHVVKCMFMGMTAIK